MELREAIERWLVNVKPGGTEGLRTSLLVREGMGRGRSNMVSERTEARLASRLMAWIDSESS